MPKKQKQGGVSRRVSPGVRVKVMPNNMTNRPRAAQPTTVGGREQAKEINQEFNQALLQTVRVQQPQRRTQQKAKKEKKKFVVGGKEFTSLKEAKAYWDAVRKADREKVADDSTDDEKPLFVKKVRKRIPTSGPSGDYRGKHVRFATSSGSNKRRGDRSAALVEYHQGCRKKRPKYSTWPASRGPRYD